MRRLISARGSLVIGFALLASACGAEPVVRRPSDTAPPSTAVTTSVSTITPPATISPTTTTLPPPTTTQPPSTTTVPPEVQQTAWTSAEAERHVENLLAALAAGAFEQAAWSAASNGIEVDGQSRDESVADFYRRICDDGSCAGPYSVEADGPGLVDPVSAQASSSVTVTHTDSGAQGSIRLGTFEGQLIIADLPPLVSSAGGPTLLEALFGDDLPHRVVVQRFDAFEIWEDGQPEWVTNWWANDTEQVEAGFGLSGMEVAVPLRDPTIKYDVECGRLMTRGNELLVLEWCWSNEWSMSVVTTGEEVATPIPSEARGDGEYVWFAERADSVVHGVGDAEGNLTSLESRRGTDLLGDDYAGYLALSADGTMVAYTDHRDPASFSHFWSPVVVVKDVSTGVEIGRWILESAVTCLEFADNWVVACEADDDLASGMPPQQAVTAIDVETGIINRVETRVRVFLPA